MATEISPANDNEKVLFVSGASNAGPGFHPHGPGERVEVTVAQLRNSYDRVVGQILAMTRGTPKDADLRLTTVEVGLAFTAEGELGFIAKATVGVEASVTLTFERD